MKEHIVCDSCGGNSLIEEINCQYCGGEIRTANNLKIINLLNHIDQSLFTEDTSDLMHKIETSAFESNPALKYRVAKLRIIKHLEDCSVLDPSYICKTFNDVLTLKEQSESYLDDFITFLEAIFPWRGVSILSEDLNTVLSCSMSFGVDFYERIKLKLVNQSLATELGIDFINKLEFYSAEKNLVNDANFIRKRDYLISKYENHLTKINSTFDKNK